MVAPIVSYTVANDVAFRRAIQRAADVCTDLRVPFTLILADFYKSEQAIFNLGGPGQYPPFKHSAPVMTFNKKGKQKYHGTPDDGKSPYQKRKIKKYGFDYPLLVADHVLASSLLGQQASGAIADIQRTALTIGTQIKYGIYHQSDKPRKKIPLRKFLFIGPEAPAFATSEQMGRPGRWMNILNDHVLKSMKGAISG